MNATPLIVSTIIMAIVFYIMLATSKEPTEDDTYDRANPPTTRWRRHLEKPSHLAFRPTRFDRHPGNSRRTQQC